jgi:two-component system LytT family sensor kinase
MTSRPPRQTRSFATLFGIAMTLIAVWIVVAIFNASEFYRSAAASGGSVRWGYTVGLQIVTGIQWAVFTPVIVAIAERLSLQAPHRYRNLLLLLIAVPAIAVARAVVGGVMLELGEQDVPTLWMAVTSIKIRIFRNMFIVAVIIGFTKLMDVYRDADERERTALALEAAVANAEAEYLRAQTQPSFMFGTLQAIRDRVSTDPAAADRMIVTLGELLRRGLDRARHGDATLEEELDFVERYLQLQRMRFGAAFAVRVEAEEDILAARVPALAMQTLVEAAIDDAQPSRVEVHGHADGKRLILEALVIPWSAHGLEARRARLAQWFGPNESVALRVEGDALVAKVELPLNNLEGVAA